MAKEVSKKTYKAAKGARNVNISQTQWKTNVAGAKGKAGRLYGPKGQRFTGTVDLGGGKKAVYREGKRVTPGKTKGGGVTSYQAPRTSNGPANTSTGGKVNEVKNPPKMTSAGPKFGGGSGYKSVTTSIVSPRSVSASARGGTAAQARSSKFRETQARTSRAKDRQAAVRGYGQIVSGNAVGGLYTLFGTKPSKDLRKRVNRGVSSARTSVTRWWQGY